MASPLHLKELMLKRSSELRGTNCTALVQMSAFGPQGKIKQGGNIGLQASKTSGFPAAAAPGCLPMT